ncbi:MAG: hypothetical protein AB8B91_15870 [Rubripirellula sp.]
MLEETEQSNDSGPTRSAQASLQFRLSTIFVLTLIATILAAFLNPRGSDRMLAALVTVLCSLAFACVVGFLRPPLVDRVFWGVVVAAMMQAVCAEVILLDRSGIYAWPIVAGFSAVIAAGQSGFYQRMAATAVIAGLIIGAYVISMSSPMTVVIAYIVCAAIGGALLTVLIDSVRWSEHRFRIPQPAIGLTLVLAAIAFSVTAAKLIPGW